MVNTWFELEIQAFKIPSMRHWVHGTWKYSLDKLTVSIRVKLQCTKVFLDDRYVHQDARFKVELHYSLLLKSSSLLTLA